MVTENGSPSPEITEDIAEEVSVEETPEAPEDGLAQLNEAVLARAKEIASQEIATKLKEGEKKWQSVADRNAARYQRERDAYRLAMDEERKFLLGHLERVDPDNVQRVHDTLGKIDQYAQGRVGQQSTEEVAMFQQINYLEQELTKAGVRYNDPRIVRDPANPDLFIDAAMAILEEKRNPKPVEETVVSKPVGKKPPAPSPSGGKAAMSGDELIKRFNDPDFEPSAEDMKRMQAHLTKLAKGG